MSLSLSALPAPNVLPCPSVALFFLCDTKVGQVATIPQRPSEVEAEVRNRNEEMKEEKGGPGTGLRSYI